MEAPDAALHAVSTIRNPERGLMRYCARLAWCLYSPLCWMLCLVLSGCGGGSSSNAGGGGNGGGGYFFYYRSHGIVLAVIAFTQPELEVLSYGDRHRYIRFFSHLVSGHGYD